MKGIARYAGVIVSISGHYHQHYDHPGARNNTSTRPRQTECSYSSRFRDPDAAARLSGRICSFQRRESRFRTRYESQAPRGVTDEGPRATAESRVAGADRGQRVHKDTRGSAAGISRYHHTADDYEHHDDHSSPRGGGRRLWIHKAA